MRNHIWYMSGFAGLIMLLCWTGCASSSAPAQMSAKDEARYEAAIQKADAENPPTIGIGDTIVVNMGSSNNSVPVAIEAPEPVLMRNFEVSRQAYDDFFNQSPGVILGRMKLDPIRDGTSLLGYRIKDIKPFEQVDLTKDDIIVGINGTMPKTPDEYFNQWQSAKENSHCVVNIQRGTERFDLTWQVK